MKSIQEIEEQKKILVEEYGLFLEKQANLTPIAARIYAVLLIEKKNGVTFDELVVFLGASKSTISTNLKNLRDTEMISYHTKPNDRKKYFTLSSSGFLSRIKESLKMYRMEQKLLIEVNAYRVLSNEVHKRRVYENVQDTPYLDFINKTIDHLEQLIHLVENTCFRNIK